MIFRIFQKWKILHMLRRTVFGYHIQHNNETKNAILHSQYHHTMYGNIVFNRFNILLAIG